MSWVTMFVMHRQRTMHHGPWQLWCSPSRASCSKCNILVPVVLVSGSSDNDRKLRGMRGCPRRTGHAKGRKRCKRARSIEGRPRGSLRFLVSTTFPVFEMASMQPHSTFCASTQEQSPDSRFNSTQAPANAPASGVIRLLTEPN